MCLLQQENDDQITFSKKIKIGISINTLLLNIFCHFLQNHCKDEFFRGTDQRILQADDGIYQSHRNPVDAVPPMVKYDTSTWWNDWTQL